MHNISRDPVAHLAWVIYGLFSGVVGNEGCVYNMRVVFLQNLRDLGWASLRYDQR